MIAVLLAVLLAAPPPCPMPHRNKGTVAKFHRLHPCPGGIDKGSKTKCQGYVVDHICPLECCGVDGIQNMQWQTDAAGKVKDRWERNCKRSCNRGWHSYSAGGSPAGTAATPAGSQKQ